MSTVLAIPFPQEAQCSNTSNSNSNDYYYNTSRSNHRHHGSAAAAAAAAIPRRGAASAPLNMANGHASSSSSSSVFPPPVLSISPINKRFGGAGVGLAHLQNGNINGGAPVTSVPTHPNPHHHHPSPVVIPSIHSASVVETMRLVLDGVDLDECEPAGENAFLVCDLARVLERYRLWQRQLGERVEAFFAIKCNPDPVILQMMARLGLGFDCASHQEIAQVLSYGVPAGKVIYANPVKASSFIRHAAKRGVELMTFDNADELAKVARFHPRAKMVLRILTDDSGSLCRFGLKFGAPLEEARGLLERAQHLGIDVVGVSFHVGSGCTNPMLYHDAIQRARWVFDLAETELGFEKFTLLDVGGGFGGDNFEEVAAVLRDAIEQYFPKEQSEGLRIIAEPGRYFVAEAFEMATNIIARRGKPASEAIMSNSTTTKDAGIGEGDEEPMVMYYINDGVYGAFNCTMFDHQVVHPKVLTLGAGETFVPDPSLATEIDERTYQPCSIWGPTCDSIDVVSKKSFLPTGEISVGDWLRWENMGAYTVCAASQFNGFKQSKIIYCIDADEQTETQIRQLLH